MDHSWLTKDGGLIQAAHVNRFLLRAQALHRSMVRRLGVHSWLENFPGWFWWIGGHWHIPSFYLLLRASVVLPAEGNYLPPEKDGNPGERETQDSDERYALCACGSFTFVRSEDAHCAQEIRCGCQVRYSKECARSSGKDCLLSLMQKWVYADWVWKSIEAYNRVHSAHLKSSTMQN